MTITIDIIVVALAITFIETAEITNSTTLLIGCYDFNVYVYVTLHTRSKFTMF